LDTCSIMRSINSLLGSLASRASSIWDASQPSAAARWRSSPTLRPISCVRTAVLLPGPAELHEECCRLAAAIVNNEREEASTRESDGVRAENVGPMWSQAGYSIHGIRSDHLWPHVWSAIRTLWPSHRSRCSSCSCSFCFLRRRHTTSTSTTVEGLQSL
jgi:hypothetical protein